MSDIQAKAVVQWAGDDLYIGTSPSGHSITVDTKGENKTAPSPVELLMIAVAGCTAVDVVSILQKKRQKITAYRAEISGTRREDHPRAFTSFHIHHLVYGHDVSEQAVARAIELSDTKYCSVAATVRPAAEIETTFEIIESE
ncbi:MAG: OsmC family protein [Acidobacteria bacterium]|nr:OsmC family protein [Acidobacteriota bacterium]MBK8812443.1 OsmC family protein [Acidobacteriota bacterium]